MKPLLQFEDYQRALECAGRAKRNGMKAKWCQFARVNLPSTYGLEITWDGTGPKSQVQAVWAADPLNFDGGYLCVRFGNGRLVRRFPPSINVRSDALCPKYIRYWLHRVNERRFPTSEADALKLWLERVAR